MTRRRCTILLLALALCGTSTATGVSAPAEAFSRHVLPNGLTVIISTNQSADLVSVQVLTRAGNRMIEPGQAGLAAFVTAMLPRGTQRRTAQDIALALESVGGTIGTSTAQDYSQLSTITPSAHVDRALDVLADMVTNAKFDPGDIETQRRITLSTIRQRLDQPSIRVQEMAAGNIFPYHPYGLPLAGTIETVSALTRDDLVRYYQTFYIASNMVIVVAGNMSQDAALDKVQRALGGIRTGVLPQRARLLPSVEKALAPRPLRPIEVRETQRSASAWIAIAYATPDVGHPDWTALRVLDTILGSGLSSRLFTEIRERRGLAYSVSSAYLTRAGPSVMLLIAATDPANLQQVIDGMQAEAAKLADTPIGAEELERGKNRIIGTTALSHEDLRNQAFLLGWYEVLGVGYAFDRQIPHLISKVTAADVQRVARTYLKNPVIAIVTPPPR